MPGSGKRSVIIPRITISTHNQGDCVIVKNDEEKATVGLNYFADGGCEH